MVLGKLKYQADGDGSVRITHLNGTATTFKVSERDAVHFAMALLSDLRPEATWNEDAPLTLKGPSQSMVALRALADGPLDSIQIAERINRKRNHACVILAMLKKLGYVEMTGCVHRAWTGRPRNVWQLTPVGQAMYEAIVDS